MGARGREDVDAREALAHRIQRALEGSGIASRLTAASSATLETEGRSVVAAKKRDVAQESTAAQAQGAQRPPAEIIYAAELETLHEDDRGPKPPGWKLSPMAVRAFILGDPARGI